MRSRDWRRSQRQRLINKRLNILKNVWIWPSANHLWYRQYGRLSKFNLKCTCRMCTSPEDKYSRAREKHLERKALVLQMEERPR